MKPASRLGESHRETTAAPVVPLPSGRTRLRVRGPAGGDAASVVQFRGGEWLVPSSTRGKGGDASRPIPPWTHGVRTVPSIVRPKSFRVHDDAPKSSREHPHRFTWPELGHSDGCGIVWVNRAGRPVGTTHLEITITVHKAGKVSESFSQRHMMPRPVQDLVPADYM